jgi:hypothetical protein
MMWCVPASHSASTDSWSTGAQNIGRSAQGPSRNRSSMTVTRAGVVQDACGERAEGVIMALSPSGDMGGLGRRSSSPRRWHSRGYSRRHRVDHDHHAPGDHLDRLDHLPLSKGDSPAPPAEDDQHAHPDHPDHRDHLRRRGAATPIPRHLASHSVRVARSLPGALLSRCARHRGRP